MLRQDDSVLRHTNASLLIAAGAHPKYIQAQLADRSATLCQYL